MTRSMKTSVTKEKHLPITQLPWLVGHLDGSVSSGTMAHLGLIE